MSADSTPLTKALLLSFEGSEGCGKSTQIKLLREHLIAQGLRVEVLREPGGSAIGEAIRHLLQHSSEGEALVPEAELLLFAASRAQLVREKIVPLLRAGVWVILDRFVDSTTVYQGVGRDLPRRSIEVVNGLATGGLMPDLTFLLDLPVAEANRRIAQSRRELDRMERQPVTFFERIRAGYHDLARADSQRIRVIDAMPEPSEVHATILQHLTPHLHGSPS